MSNFKFGDHDPVIFSVDDPTFKTMGWCLKCRKCDTEIVCRIPAHKFYIYKSDLVLSVQNGLIREFRKYAVESCEETKAFNLAKRVVES